MATHTASTLAARCGTTASLARWALLLLASPVEIGREQTSDESDTRSAIHGCRRAWMICNTSACERDPLRLPYPLAGSWHFGLLALRLYEVPKP